MSWSCIGPTNPVTKVREFYGTVYFLSEDDSSVYYLDGQTIIPKNQPNIGKLYDIDTFQNKIYVCGVGGIKVMNGNNWDIVPQFLGFDSLFNMSADNNYLYVIGGFDMVNNIHYNAIAQFDGNTVNALPAFSGIPVDFHVPWPILDVSTCGDGKVWFAGYFWSNNPESVRCWNENTQMWDSVHTNTNDISGRILAIPDGRVFCSEVIYGTILEKSPSGIWTCISNSSLIGDVYDFVYDKTNDVLYAAGVYSANNTSHPGGVGKYKNSTWQTNLVDINNGDIYSMALTPSGIYLGGDFYHYNGIYCPNLIFGTEVTGIPNTPKNNALEISPNPATDFISISGADNSLVKIYDITGKILLETSPIDSKINISDFNPGIYFLKSDEVMLKFVKE